MLTDQATSDMARYALERIPGEAVDKALRKALPKATGKAKVGIINTLGVRGDLKAVAALGKLIRNADPMIAAASVGALGRIGGSKATEVLSKAKGQTSGKLRQLVLDAYLKCADQLAAEGKKEQALAIYEQLYTSNESEPIRSAALRGMVTTTTTDKAIRTVRIALRGKDQAMQTTAITLIREIPGTKIIKRVTAELPKLSAASQVQLLSALADRGDPIALPPVVKAAKSSEESVRIAAFIAMGALGNASNVSQLAHEAAKKKGAEQEAARQSLYRLRGPKVDKTILALIKRAHPRAKVELIRSIERRRIYAGTEVLFKTAKNVDTKVSVESIKVLKAVAEPKHLPKLVELLIKVKKEAERKEAEKTVVAVSRKITDSDRQAEAVLAALPGVKKIKARCSLLSVLGKIGDINGLGVLRDALKDRNEEVQAAAIRALSDWPDSEPIADLLKAAQTSDNKTHQVLALRGLIRLIGLDSARPAEETIKLYSQAMELASQVSEKKTILSGLAKLKTFAALQMTATYLEDKDLQQEAEFAVIKIAQNTVESNTQQTRTVLNKVLQITENDSVRKQAQQIIDKLNK